VRASTVRAIVPSPARRRPPSFTVTFAVRVVNLHRRSSERARAPRVDGGTQSHGGRASIRPCRHRRHRRRRRPRRDLIGGTRPLQGSSSVVTAAGR